MLATAGLIMECVIIIRNTITTCFDGLVQTLLKCIKIQHQTVSRNLILLLMLLILLLTFLLTYLLLTYLLIT